MDRKTTLASLCIVTFLACLPIGASAQRTMENQDVITAQASLSCEGFRDAGASLSWGRYHRGGVWNVEASWSPWSVDTGKDALLHYMHVTAGGNWVQRIVSDRRRIFSLYGGGGALLGVQVIDPNRQLPPHLSVKGARKVQFLYGAKAVVQMEIYPLRRVGLVLSAESACTSPRNPRIFHFTLKAGVRVAL